MNDGILESSNLTALGFTLYHVLWQGALIGGLALLLLWWLRKASANARYVVAYAALAAMFLFAAGTFWWCVGGNLQPPSIAIDVAASVPLQDAAFTERTTESMSPQEFRGSRSRPIHSEAYIGGPTDRASNVASPIAVAAAAPWHGRAARALRDAAPWIAMAWLAGALVMAFRFAMNIACAHRLPRQGVKPAPERLLRLLTELTGQMHITRPVQLLESTRAAMPCVVGCLRPVILLPVSACCGLAPEELKAVLAHELAHVRRHDFVLNVVQNLVHVVLFFHPVAWWLHRRIVLERERCCDDLAVAIHGDPETYAGALAAVARLAQSAPALAPAAGGSLLLGRIRRVLGLPPVSDMHPAPRFAGGTAVLAVAAMAVWALSAGQARADREARTLEFGDGMPDAKVLIRPESSITWRANEDDGWVDLGEAKGSIEVPAAHWVRLDVPRPVDSVDALVSLPPDAVQALLLERGDVTDEHLRRIAERYTDLRMIGLYKTSVTDEGIKWLATLPTLTHFNLGRTNVTDAGLAYLAKKKNLSYIDLNRLAITDAGIARLVGCPELKWLGLKGAGITDAAMASIGQMTGLEGLRVDDTAVTPDALLSLAPLRSLKYFEVESNVSAEILMALRHLPAFQEPDLPREIPLTIIDTNTRQGLVAAVRVSTDGIDAYQIFSGDDGRVTVRLPEGERKHLTINAKVDGYVPTTATWRPDGGALLPEAFTMPMEKGTAIASYVKDEGGIGIPGTTVHLLVPTNNAEILRPAIWDYTVTTDETGRWSCDIMPSELTDVWIRLTHPDFSSDPMYGSTPKPSIDELRAGTGVMTMKRGITVAGVVLDAAGNPVGGADVVQGRDRWGSSFPSTRTDSQGRFEFPQSGEGEMIVTVQKAGHAPAVEVIHVTKDPDEVRVILEEPRTVRGRVEDENGKPLSGVSVVADTWRGYRAINWRAETDSEGQFRWDSAPADAVAFDIVKKEHMSKRNIELLPGETEHVVTLAAPLVIQGTVTDAVSGEPLEAFKVTRGIRWESGQVSWQDDPAQGNKGAYSFTLTYPYPGYVLRAEAEGYLPVLSDPITDQTGTVTADLAMQKGSGTAGTLRTAAGEPVAGADIFVATATQQVRVQNGVVRARETPAAAKTSAEGHFELPPQIETYALVVMDSQGYAEVDQASFEANSDIVLQPWAKVAGTVKIGREPAGDERIYLSYDRPWHNDNPRIVFHDQTHSMRDGTFTFGRVVPGEVKVYRGIPLGHQRYAYSHEQSINASPGETANVTIGGTGRPVTGKVSTPEGLGDPPKFEAADCRLNTKPPEMEYPEEWAAMSLDEQEEWRRSFVESDAYKIQMRERRSYAFEPSADGTFTIDDVEPGTYTLDVTLNEPPAANQCGVGEPVARGSMEVIVPDMQASRSDEPLEIAALALEIYSLPKLLQPGAIAPDFTVETTDGGTVRLADLRGKFVLLDFWATWCGPCVVETPHLKAAYDALKDHSNFAMVGLSLDQSIDAPKKYAEEKELGWIQGFLGEWSKTDVPSQYGVRGIPSVFLIDPEGKIAATNLRGPELKSKVEQLMQAAAKGGTAE